MLVGTKLTSALQVGRSFLHVADIYRTHNAKEAPQLHTELFCEVGPNYSVSTYVVRSQPISNIFRDAIGVCAAGKQKLSLNERLCVATRRKLLVTFDHVNVQNGKLESWKQIQDLSKSAGLSTSNFVFSLLCNNCGIKFDPFEGKWKSPKVFIASLLFCNASLSTGNVMFDFNGARLIITNIPSELQMIQMEQKDFILSLVRNPMELMVAFPSTHCILNLNLDYGSFQESLLPSLGLRCGQLDCSLQKGN